VSTRAPTRFQVLARERQVLPAHLAILLDVNSLNVGQEGAVCSHVFEAVIGYGSLDTGLS
jgi:hypothetical protein